MKLAIWPDGTICDMDSLDNYIEMFGEEYKIIEERRPEDVMWYDWYETEEGGC